MSNEIKKLFVYGTLLQGEPRSRFLQDSDLLGSLEVPGELYITGMGYPAASFKRKPNQRVCGELYELSGDNITDKIMMLDEIEGIENGLFKRKELEISGHHFFAYEAGGSLDNFLMDRYRIKSGNWRLHGSIAKKDPIKFALDFENFSAKSYRELPLEGTMGSIHLRGEAPILVTAPHASAHLRMSKLKSQETFTGSLSVILHAMTGSHALYTHRASKIDPNFYDESSFKKKMARIVKSFGIRFVLDVHGTSTTKVGDVFPGVGFDNEFLVSNEVFIDKLIKCSKRFGIRLGGSKIFPASRQMTVTKFVARNLGIPAMQIEVNEKLRSPDILPQSFEKLVSFLVCFLSTVKDIC
ncbi:MAG: gamma-glutamylcyclotransferase [Deltaproteobacteria bacterium]|nr:gamma-glutamylcyclotransferase [Deltaproteobacteria bacterium]